MTNSASESARRNFLKHEPRGPLLLGDWCEAVFLHYAVAPKVLQPFVPMELDRWGGQAWVSLVAFTMRRLRPAIGGRLTEWLMRPFATQRFLNLRTYVRCGGETGIYFLREWNSSLSSVWLAPRLYGLPYCHAKLNYRHERGMRNGSGIVRSAFESLDFGYRCVEASGEPCVADSLDEFLLERYIAFASAGRRLRFFRVWHAPWLQARAANLHISDNLVRHGFDWWQVAQFVGAAISPGAADVWMGRPRQAV